jgi:hypothetical protein
LGGVVHDALVGPLSIAWADRATSAGIPRRLWAVRKGSRNHTSRTRTNNGKFPLWSGDRQDEQAAQEAIDELPMVCDRGTKKNAQRDTSSWNGYKLHLISICRSAHWFLCLSTWQPGGCSAD